MSRGMERGSSWQKMERGMKGTGSAGSIAGKVGLCYLMDRCTKVCLRVVVGMGRALHTESTASYTAETGSSTSNVGRVSKSGPTTHNMKASTTSGRNPERGNKLGPRVPATRGNSKTTKSMAPESTNGATGEPITVAGPMVT
jgi:hypothetical protein